MGSSPKNKKMNKGIEIYIGIDPDVDRSGVGIWSPSMKSLKVEALKFFELFRTLESYQMVEINMFVRIEAGWLNKKSNFHGSAYQSKAAGERIAKNVGENHAVGKKIGEMCEYLGIDYEFVIPQGKVTPEYFTKLTHIQVKKKDQDMIDAAMLVYGL